MNFFEEYYNLTSEEIFKKLNEKMPPRYFESGEVEEEWKEKSIFEQIDMWRFMIIRGYGRGT